MNFNSLKGKNGASPPASLKPKAPVVDVNERTVLAAKAVARDKTKKLLDRNRLSPVKSWDEAAAIFGGTIPDGVRALPINTLTLNAWCSKYVTDTEKRIAEAQLQAETQVNIGIVLKDDLLPFNLKSPPFRPILRQRRAYSQIMRELYAPNTSNRAGLIPLEAGSGKTAIAASVIIDLQRNNYYGAKVTGLYNVIYLCPKRVQIATRRKLVAAGVAGVDTEVQVITYNQLSTKLFDANFIRKKVERFGSETEVFEWRLKAFAPALVIVDECHKVKKHDTMVSRRVQAFLEFINTRWLFMSASAAVVPNDLMLFALASRKRYLDGPITYQNWREVAWAIGGSDPSRVDRFTEPAMERMMDYFGDLRIVPPKDPRTVKALNRIICVPFETPEQRTKYLKAEEDWLEQCERLGKIPSEAGQVMAQTTIFRAAADRLLAPTIARLAYEAHQAGFAPVIGLPFTDAIKRVIMEWTQRFGVDRKEISLIWGGSKIIKEEDTMPMLEWIQVQRRIDERDGDMSFLSRAEIALYRRTTRFLSERWKSGDTEQEQRDRNNWLERMFLSPQNAEQQQLEVDKFQSGATKFCIFSLGAGSVGIDLDHQHDQTRPRASFFSPTFYAEEIVQAFGRCYRESTISNVTQTMVFFDQTIVARVVAPKLARKISSINKVGATGMDLEASLIEAAVSGKARKMVMADLPAPVATDTTLDDEDGDIESDDDDN